MLKQTYKIPCLPPKADFETVPIFKALTSAHRFLAELKGRAAAIPNQGILIDTLSLQEARASSEIENIVTTQDELFRTNAFPENPSSPTAKEVSRYRDALHLGHQELRRSNGLITNNTIVSMYQLLKRREDSFRDTPGTTLKNDATGEVVYVPPQEKQFIISHMTELERYINDDDQCDLDPLIKMAIIHHQFESIHPFPDGNGRIGRLLNVLYLTKSGLLDIPILYLSRHITSTKDDYYRLLQSVRETGKWEEWTVYILNAVAETAQITLWIIEQLRMLIADYKARIRRELHKIYSQDLLNNLFRHPYTRIEYVQADLGVTRQTASRYLDALAESGFVQKEQIGRNNYYVNLPLLELFVNVSGK